MLPIIFFKACIRMFANVNSDCSINLNNTDTIRCIFAYYAITPGLSGNIAFQSVYLYNEATVISLAGFTLSGQTGKKYI